MKKMAAILLAMIITLSGVGGCGLISAFRDKTDSRSTLSDRDTETISSVEDIIIDSEEINEEIIDLIDKQIEVSGKFIKEYAASIENGTIYDSTDYDTRILQNQLTINELVFKVEGLADDLSDLNEPKSDEALMVFEAANIYMEKLNRCLADLLAVVTLYVDQSEATQPINDFNETEYGDDVYLMIEDLYAAIERTVENFKQIDSCPDYMKESMDIYTRKMGIYLKMLEEWYDGLSLNDPLRLASGNQLMIRQNVDVVRFEAELFELYDLQYIKVRERLEGNISQLKDELLENCAVLGKPAKKIPEVTFTYLDEIPTVTVDYNYAQTIYPGLYSSLDSVVNLTASSDHGSIEVMLTVEIPGLTQKFQQKLTISEQVTKLLLKPPLLIENLNLESSRETQLRLTIEDLDNDRTILEETKTVSLMSVYDFLLHDDEFGIASRDNVLAWLTPESDAILNLRRSAITWIDYWSEGQINSLIGYQDYGLFDDPALNTYIQIIAIQGAISDLGVRYNMGPFSMSEGINQRVMLPDKVLSSGSGICIETAILFASAIQSTDMHAMILFLPGHAQVAVETGYMSGEYYLVETTLLPFAGDEEEEMDRLVRYLTADEWTQYLEDPWGDGSGGAYVVDCDLVHVLGFKAIGYK
ncbi:MAG: hypothetical protein GX099_01315 [Clostridiaceae bacterium]|jgi:hypothetical protein|nr:hypothetical protein [Oscillospiraceae bacterium]NLO62053.1 hypothetical protein [Clostridiaceae bacterium]